MDSIAKYTGAQEPAQHSQRIELKVGLIVEEIT
jgi:hypothetical protein